ncbi:hypothetical protein ONZ45_g18122 [Pleurotus djamor]|nr:hypothetical protein ONZ45_g18122 [Pleurotus djamor]
MDDYRAGTMPYEAFASSFMAGLSTFDAQLPSKVHGRPHVHQETQPSAYVEADWYIKGLETRVHTRFVTVEVGFPLKSFHSTKVFLQVVRDAFVGHRDAYTRCHGALHRDVSTLPKVRGVLNDWDMARVMKSGPHNHDRVGTWPFMSSRLLMRPRSPRTLNDDIESFFWVVLHHALRYSRHNLEASLTAAKIQDVFFYTQHIFDHLPVGGYEKYCLLMHDLRKMMHGQLDFESKPLNQFIDEANQFFQDSIDAIRWKIPPSEDPQGRMLQVFDNALNAVEWPEDDHAVDILESVAQTTANYDTNSNYSFEDLPEGLESKEEALDKD